MHARTVLFGVWVAGAVTLQAGYLGPADGYNGFFFGNYTSANSDVGGKLAAGGNINIANFGVAAGYPAKHFDGQYALIAGGNLTATNGQLYSGNAFAGGTGTLTSFNLASVNASLTEGGPSPIDFAAAETELKTKSQQLKDLGGTAVGPNVGFEFVLDVANSALAVFLLDSSDFCAGCSVRFLNVGANSTVVVNVKGVAVNGTNASYFINGLDLNASGALANRILFNYFEATDLFMNSGVQGSVLAPYAAVTSTWGKMLGQLVAHSYSNACASPDRCDSLELHDFNFNGDPGELPPPSSEVPEPSTWLLSAAGLVAVAMRRARRR